MIRALILTSGLLGALLPSEPADAQATSFTYQGELSDADQPANGAYALGFSLWTAASGGTQIGVTLMRSVNVADGRFTAALDWGADAFDNAPRWLEITVDGVVQSPRQSLTRTPYALQTRGIFVRDNNRVGIGTTSPAARFTVVSDTANATDNTARFEAPLLGGRVSHIHWGPTGDWYIRSASTAGNVLIQDNGGNVGIGTSNPQAPLHVEHSGSTAAISAIAENGTGLFARGPVGIYGLSTHSPSPNRSAIGVQGEASVAWGIGVFGLATSTASDAAGVFGRADNPDSVGVLGQGAEFAVGVEGRVFDHLGAGIGVRGSSDNPAGYDFFADGIGQDFGSSSSIRWKRNVVAIAQPLDKVGRLRGVYFDWDADHGAHHDVGMIAEEVGKVLPEIVTYEQNGVDAVGMDYSKLTPLLVEAVKALRDELDALRAETAAVHAENAALRARVETLETPASNRRLAAESVP